MISWIPKGFASFARREVDPPSVKNGALETRSQDDELEDLTIDPKDAALACVRNKHGRCHLEVSIYKDLGDGDSNLYLHHEVALSAHALCAAWLACPFKGDDEGNFMAVGTLSSSIEIWDLDIVDETHPTVVLGCNDKTNKNSTGNVGGGNHTGSVLGLAWNCRLRSALASASSDKLVKIWDVSTGKCEATMEHHTDCVTSVAWNHAAAPLLLSGSSDRWVVVRDPRMPRFPGWKWHVGVEVQSVAWNPIRSCSFVVALGDGTVQGFDLQAMGFSGPPIFTFHAHDEAVISVSYSIASRNLLATGSEDNTVKLWDLSNNQPTCIATHNPNTGDVLSVSFSFDNPFLLAIGGSNGQLEVWDTSLIADVATRFGNLRLNYP